MTSYRDFAVKYESGMTIMEIAAQGEISRRTAYRYKAYYDEVQKNKGNMHE
jgi:predicted DNA-binding transcriptional regulator YafY